MSDKRPHHLEAAAREAEAAFLADTYRPFDRLVRRGEGIRAWASLDDFDQHESGQLRLVVAGEQTHLLPLPDSLIPPNGGAMTPDLDARSAKIAETRGVPR